MEFLVRSPLTIIFGSIVLPIIVSTIAYYWHSAHRNNLDAVLKQDMLERGFSADEIVQVVRAGKTKFVKRDAQEQPRFKTAVRIHD